ncbi:MAG: transcription antitermination factor NusB [Bacteroidales bacterium]
MLTRRDIRIKVMQALYAFIQSENNRLDQGEKKLLESIDRIYTLYIWQLSFLNEVVEFARRRIEENTQKMLPTYEDLNPNSRFVDNRILASLSKNRDFITLSERYKINWSLQEETIRKFYNELRETPAYMEFMTKDENTFEDDREILLFITRDLLVNFELLQYFYEETDINWVDDYDTVLILLERTIKGWKERQTPENHLPPLIKPTLDGEDDDRLFAKQLFSKVLLHYDKYDKIIEEKISNWEFDRVAKVDIILLRMAVCEFLEFPSIPVKVTINEYIDISKIFSSPKSKLFINGMLDKLALHFRDAGTLVKTGRGLIDH